jgi:hypothetical protein
VSRSDPRPPLRWLPIALGLAVAVLLIIVQLTRSTDSADMALTPADARQPATEAPGMTKETPVGSPPSSEAAPAPGVVDAGAR